MGFPHNLPNGTISVLLGNTREFVERQAVKWVDGPENTGSDGVGNEDLGAKPVGDESVMGRGAPQLDVQELRLEQ